MWTQVTPPAKEPLDISEAKADLHLTDSNEDLFVADAIVAAREYVEMFTRRRLLTQTWDWRLSGFPSFPLLIPYPPLQSVTSLTYRLDEVATVWAPANYRALTASGPMCPRGQIVLTDAAVTPTPDTVPDALTIRVVQGYGNDGSSVPAAIRRAMKVIIGELFEQRQITIVGTITATAQFTVEHLLWPFRDLGWRRM